MFFLFLITILEKYTTEQTVQDVLLSIFILIMTGFFYLGSLLEKDEWEALKNERSCDRKD